METPKLLETSPRSDLRPVRGEGCWLWDEAGKRYLDLLAGTWCNVLGHGNPRFTRTIQAQIEKLIHTGSGVVTQEIQAAAECLSTVLPAHLDRVTFLNTGSEAVELAIKIARIAAGRMEVVGFQYGYYGATNQALALSEAGRGAPYLPEAGSIPPIPAPACYRCRVGETYPGCRFRCLQEWQANVEGIAHEVAAIIFEPVLAAGGVIVPPPGYLRALAELARSWGCLLIAEEVTTGVGRTGCWFAFQHDCLSPDVLVLGKALGNGLPVAAVVTTAQVEEACAGRLRHVQSHQNDPFSGAVATVVIDIIRQEGLVERAREMGAYLLQVLRHLQSGYPGISDVRGLGLMAALELKGEEADERGIRIQSWLRDAGIILDFQPYTATFRFFPPYLISRDQLDHALQILDQGFRDTE
jgi:2,2-dialkylglycine decarboxylase (pyruvate)